MLGLIQQEIIELLPAAVALCGMCFLLLIAVLITRALTIQQMRKYWPDMANREIEAKDRLIKKLQEDNKRLVAENNDWCVKVKTIKAVTDKVVE